MRMGAVEEEKGCGREWERKWNEVKFARGFYWLWDAVRTSAWACVCKSCHHVTSSTFLEKQDGVMIHLCLPLPFICNMQRLTLTILTNYFVETVST